MARITGLGGIFYKVEDTDKTRAWYQEKLGIGGEWGAMFPFKNDDPEGFTLFSQFKADTDYFGPSDKSFMRPVWTRLAACGPAISLVCVI